MTINQPEAKLSPPQLSEPGAIFGVSPSENPEGDFHLEVSESAHIKENMEELMDMDKSEYKGGIKKTDVGLFSESFLQSSSLYTQYLRRNEEVQKHKWYESERAGRDIGVDQAFFDWLLKHSKKWHSSSRQS